MKKLITLLFFALFVCINSYSQATTRKYEYAIVQLDINEIKIFYGNKKEETFDAINKRELKGQAYRNTNSIVDALNYMDGMGYELTSSNSVQLGIYQYTFKREIKK